TNLLHLMEPLRLRGLKIRVILVALIVASVNLVSTPCTTYMISSFTPCANIITGSTNNGLVPPSTCCDSLRSLMSTNMDCACLVISANAPFFQLPINQALALSLSQACNINGVPLQCKGANSIASKYLYIFTNFTSGSPLPAPGPSALGLNGPTLSSIATSPLSPQVTKMVGVDEAEKYENVELASVEAEAPTRSRIPQIRPVLTPRPSPASHSSVVSLSPFAFLMLAIRKLKTGPDIPFVLCVMVANCNYGTARVSNYKSVQSICPYLANSSSQAFTVASENKFTLQGVCFSSVAERILVQARDPAKVSLEIQNAIDANQLDNSWKLFEQHMHMEGFPRKSITSKLVTSCMDSLNIKYLGKAYELVERAIEEGKQGLSENEVLIYLSFGLTKARLPVPASIVLRKMIDTEHFPSLLGLQFWHTCHEQRKNRVDPRKKSNAPLMAMKPNAAPFSTVLAECPLFERSRKAYQLLDMMPRIGVKADAKLLMIIILYMREMGEERSSTSCKGT
ncbi:Pentatricopeptide repeat-containing protein, mitochondrial, partial [Mucuna pruriens]